MGTWPGVITAITMFVEDVEEAKRFYTNVFDMDPVFEDEGVAVVFQLGPTLLNMLISSQGDDLIGPAAVGGRDAPARVQFTLTVDDVDARAAALVAKGVSLVNGPMDRAWGIRTACFADPSGHLWEIAAPLRASSA